jgi:hypothetical protein
LVLEMLVSPDLQPIVERTDFSLVVAFFAWIVVCTEAVGNVLGRL